MFDYDRTVVAYHGTHRRAAHRLVDGEPFSPSNNRDDWLGHGMTDLYLRFFHFPTLAFRVEPDLAALAVAVCAAAAAVGALGAMRQALRLAPAEAMRPPAPSRYTRGLLSRLGLGPRAATVSCTASVGGVDVGAGRRTT